MALNYSMNKIVGLATEREIVGSGSDLVNAM
jgi:hypothetical protein